MVERRCAYQRRTFFHVGYHAGLRRYPRMFANADMAGLLQGPICPVVLPSRSDSGLSKYYSIAMACLQVAGCECREKLNLNR